MTITRTLRLLVILAQTIFVASFVVRLELFDLLVNLHLLLNRNVLTLGNKKTYCFYCIKWLHEVEKRRFSYVKILDVVHCFT